MFDPINNIFKLLALKMLTKFKGSNLGSYKDD